MKNDIGLIGLAVMGENLVMNMESKGFSVSVYNRTQQRVIDFINGRAKGKRITGTFSLEELVGSLRRPRIVMMMIKAGSAVDDMIDRLIPLLEPGDIIVDGGNSHFPDTARRTAYVESKGLLYVGTGVSGGEEGALRGPSMMPGGSFAAWEHVRPIFHAVCAKVDGSPCCDWVGEGGAGHFVKMVHNGIEYGDMQLICEAYDLMRRLPGFDCARMSEVFREWNKTELDSYLIEITGDILARTEADGTPTVDLILDTAGQKGTGKWTAAAALDAGVPLTLISEAVFARCLSAMKSERVVASETFGRGKITLDVVDAASFVDDIRSALYASKIVSYAQGFQLMRSAAKEYGWALDYGAIAMMWRGGCIIRSAFLGKIKQAFDESGDSLENLLLAPYFRDAVIKCLPGWRRVCAAALTAGVPLPAMTSALCWFDSSTSERLPANLLQAQRDYFGAHTYERTDRPRGEFFHTDWTGSGGSTASTNYNV